MNPIQSRSVYLGEDFALRKANYINSRHFHSVDFQECSFRFCDLHRYAFNFCTFTDCDFTGAKLEACEFQRNTLKDCLLTGTCFDSANTPNRPPRASGKGFRTRHPIHLGGEPYVVGETYEAPIFSTADTACHPGLYFYLTLTECNTFYYPHPLIEVSYSPEDVHYARGKYRTKKFTVVREVPPEEAALSFKLNCASGLERKPNP